LFSEIHTKHANTLCGQNVEFMNDKPDSTLSNHCAVMVQKQLGPNIWGRAGETF